MSSKLRLRMAGSRTDASAEHAAAAMPHVCERERAEIEASMRLHNALHARLLHEMKTPLFDISLNAHVIERLPAAAPDAIARRSACAAEIREALTRVNLLVASLLDVDRFGAGGFAMDRRTHGVAEMVDVAAEAVQPLASAHRVALSTRVREGVRGVACDYPQMVRALAALIANGVRRTPEGGRAQLVVADTGLSMRFTMRDGGAPVDDDELARITTPNDERRPLPPGLSITSRVAALHGGTLKVRYDEDGDVAFDLVLPSTPPPR